MNKNKLNSDKVFQFKITLNDYKPRIWRRIVVPADYTFFDLHCAIQNAMGWTDSHLHSFRVGERWGSDRIFIEYPSKEDYPLMEGERRDERNEQIADYFGQTITQCVYDYDFGDSWDHTIVFEKELAREPNTLYPQCLKGENACPPEDCGGTHGYANLCALLKDPHHTDYADMVDWLCLDSGKDFDPTVFNAADVKFEDPKKRLSEWRDGFGE